MVSYTPGWILEDICDFYTFYLKYVNCAEKFDNY